MKTLLGTEGGIERIIFQIGRWPAIFYLTVKFFGRWRIRVYWFRYPTVWFGRA